jgi:hypothetical protein
MFVTKQKKPEKIDWRVQIPPELADRADSLFDRVGQTRSEALVRVLTWLMSPSGDRRLDARIQRHILDVLTEDMEVDIALVQLKKMANEQAEGASPAGAGPRTETDLAGTRTTARRTRSSKKKQSPEAG